MTDTDPKREPANDYHTHRPLWRLPVIVIGMIIGLVGWIVVKLIW